MVRQLLHDCHKFWRTALVHLLRVVHREHESVGVPVSEQVSSRGDDKCDHRTSRAADQITYRNKQARQARE